MGSGENQFQNSKVYDTELKSQKLVGTVIFFLLFGLGGIWAATAPINGAALASGTVMVRSYSKIVQHLEGGIISDIFVENGARVRQGDPILELDDTQPLAQLEIVNSEYTALKALEARLLAERDELPELIYPSSFSAQSDTALQESIAQEEIFIARKSTLEGGVAILEQRIGQLQSQISGLFSLQESKKALQNLMRKKLKTFVNF